MQSSRKSSKILEFGWKWIENALPGLRIGQNEPQYYDESNGTPPDPKYPSRKFKIPLKSDISEIQKCPLNLATNRMSNYYAIHTRDGIILSEVSLSPAAIE